MAYTKDEWWRNGIGGQRTGWLKPGEFTRMVCRLFGVKGTHYQAPLMQFAEWVGVGKSTVYRWALGQDPIPKWVALLIESERLVWTRGDDHTIVEAPWLPYSTGANGRQHPVTPPDGGSTSTQQSKGVDPRMLDEASSGEGAFMPPP